MRQIVLLLVWGLQPLWLWVRWALEATQPALRQAFRCRPFIARRNVLRYPERNVETPTPRNR